MMDAPEDERPSGAGWQIKEDFFHRRSPCFLVKEEVLNGPNPKQIPALWMVPSGND
jgi:hypothetical protein